MNETAIQQATVALVNARRQLAYRQTLVAEAQRDLKNKTEDYNTSARNAALALETLLKACDERPV